MVLSSILIALIVLIVGAGFIRPFYSIQLYLHRNHYLLKPTGG